VIGGTHRGAGAGQRGIALVLVLWGLVLIAIIAAGVASTTRTEATLARNGADNARARAMAEAGVQRAVLALLDTRAEYSWSADGTPYTFTLDEGDGEVAITIFDERGKVDLNAGSNELLRAVFVGVGVDDDTADSLVDAVVDFRDKDDLRRLNGAEDRDYRAAGLGHEAKDAPFEAVDELRQVLGMTRAHYRRLAPMLTVHSGRDGIDPLRAPRALLLALPGVDAERIAELMAERVAGDASTDAAILQAIPPTPGIRLNTSRGRPSVATVRAVARLPGGATYVREAVIRLTGKVASPYRILAWRQGRRRPPTEAP
jgi:general secretion pathway protein K